MLLGEYKYNVDAKGRLFIPAKFRESLGDNFIIAKSIDKCISIYSSEMWEKYVEKLAMLPEMQAKSIRRFLFSSAQEVSCDSQGRIVVAPSLREHASLEKEVTIIGVNDRAEIWDSKVYDDYMNSNSIESMIAVLSENGF